MALVRRVRDGREEWVEAGPARCRNGHPDPVSAWRPCGACSYACTHWACRTCGDAVPDVEHACRR